MSHKKKENRGRKRKPRIPYVRVIPTEKQKLQRTRRENTPSMTYNTFEHESNESIPPEEENDSRRSETHFTADKERDGMNEEVAMDRRGNQNKLP